MSRCRGPSILDLDNSWSGVVSFTLQSLYLQGKIPRYSMGRRLRKPQTALGKILFLPWFELGPIDRPARGQSLFLLLSRLPLR
jgi:hypothetical protein